MSHTSGPWTLSEWGGHYDIGPGVMKVAEIPRSLPEAGANARLIAAAPDLLALLRELRDEWFEPHYAHNDIGMAAVLRDKIRAAIAKAEGRDAD